MKDNKQKRFEYLRANKAYLSEREKQEYYELVEEIEGWQALEEEYAADLEEERAQSESSSSERRSRSSRSLDSAPAAFLSQRGKKKESRRAEENANDETSEETASKKPKKKLEKEVPKKDSLDTSALLKKKSDRKKI